MTSRVAELRPAHVRYAVRIYVLQMCSIQLFAFDMTIHGTGICVGVCTGCQMLSVRVAATLHFIVFSYLKR